MDKIFWDSWRAAQQRSEIWLSNSSGLSCSSLCRQSALANSYLLSQNKFLSGQKNFVSVTEEIDWTVWVFQWLHSKGLVGVGFELSITWKIFLSISSTPLTVRCFLWLKKEKMKLWKQKSSRFIFLKWIPSLQGHTNFFTFKVFRNPKSSVEELHF